MIFMYIVWIFSYDKVFWISAICFHMGPVRYIFFLNICLVSHFKFWFPHNDRTWYIHVHVELHTVMLFLWGFVCCFGWCINIVHCIKWYYNKDGIKITSIKSALPQQWNLPCAIERLTICCKFYPSVWISSNVHVHWMRDLKFICAVHYKVIACLNPEIYFNEFIPLLKNFL